MFWKLHPLQIYFQNIQGSLVLPETYPSSQSSASNVRVGYKETRVLASSNTLTFPPPGHPTLQVASHTHIDTHPWPPKFYAPVHPYKQVALGYKLVKTQGPGEEGQEFLEQRPIIRECEAPAGHVPLTLWVKKQPERVRAEVQVAPIWIQQQHISQRPTIC